MLNPAKLGDISSFGFRKVAPSTKVVVIPTARVGKELILSSDGASWHLFRLILDNLFRVLGFKVSRPNVM